MTTVPAVCSIDGCQRVVKARGWCMTHYQRWRLVGDPEMPDRRRRPERGPCSVPGCPAPIAARQWCRPHYRRWWQHGDPLAGGAEYPSCCSVGGCNRSVEARGYCTMHYSRWRKHGDPLVVGRVAADCSVDGCPSKAHSQGLCGKHFMRWKRHGDPELITRVWTARPADGACVVDGCTKPAKQRAMCPMHYYRFRRNGDPASARRLTGRKKLNGRAHASRYRAKKMGLQHERIDAAAVFDRDSWHCHICGGAIDAAVLWPNPMAPSLDHVIPLAAGGGHLYSNVAASHLRCNMQKGARMASQPSSSD